MAAHPEEFRAFLGPEFEAYLASMRQSGVWGDELTLVRAEPALHACASACVCVCGFHHCWGPVWGLQRVCAADCRAAQPPHLNAPPAQRAISNALCVTISVVIGARQMVRYIPDDYKPRATVRGKEVHEFSGRRAHFQGVGAANGEGARGHLCPINPPASTSPHPPPVTTEWRRVVPRPSLARDAAQTAAPRPHHCSQKSS